MFLLIAVMFIIFCKVSYVYNVAVKSCDTNLNL